MKSLADQIRQQLVKPDAERLENPGSPVSKTPRKPKTKEIPALIADMLAYDTGNNKNMVHARFDEKTVRTMNQFKMATGIDVSRFVSFAVKHLLDTCPELKTTIKQFIQFKTNMKPIIFSGLLRITQADHSNLLVFLLCP